MTDPMLTIFRKSTLTLLMFLSLFTASISAAEQPSKQPLFFYVFIHDDIPSHKRESLRKDYFAWLLKDLEGFTGRRIYLEFIEHRAPLTGFRYQGEDLNSTLNDWTQQVNDYRISKNLPNNIRGKYLLLTYNNINEYTLGVTRLKHHAGIASLGTYPAAAHEIGHMLGGTHEAAEILYKGGWWCETNLTATRFSLRANCYHYSDKNKQAIAAYLSESP
ncbi:hypothetical protein [Pseudomonas sp. NA-150]|uniref:hypothetical protein n=1 Tax=Pseudomonas sp. NA-150 TaxID=3367525 RepID=UPI0037CAFD4B